MKSLYLAAGLALIIHGLLFSINADWLQGEFVPNREQKPLSMTMTYRSPQKPLPEPVTPPPVLKMPVQPKQKKKILRPEIPDKTVSSPSLPLPSRDESKVEDRPGFLSYEVPDTEFNVENDRVILDHPPEGYESNSQDLPDKLKRTDINTKQGIVYPRAYEDNARPQYPRIARRRGYEGVVILKALVSREGEVLEIRVLKTSGHSILDEEAIQAVQKYRFEPGKEDGVNTDMWVNIPIRFQLK